MILSHALRRITIPSLEGAKGNFASAEAGFRACGHDQRTEPVWRLCDRPLETFARSLLSYMKTNVGRSRRLCQPP